MTIMKLYYVFSDILEKCQYFLNFTQGASVNITKKKIDSILKYLKFQWTRKQIFCTTYHTHCVDTCTHLPHLIDHIVWNFLQHLCSVYLFFQHHLYLSTLTTSRSVTAQCAYQFITFYHTYHIKTNQYSI